MVTTLPEATAKVRSLGIVSATINAVSSGTHPRRHRGQARRAPCLIDGEIAIYDDHGLAVFQRLRHGNRIKPEAILIAFDLLQLDGEDLRPMPIEIRKHKLSRLVRNAGAGLHLSDHLHGDGAEIFAHACKLGCEYLPAEVCERMRRDGGSVFPARANTGDPNGPVEACPLMSSHAR
jgi:hypothetical protein